MAGTLYLVATPIGNLEDLSARALRVLGEVDFIACEDTRRTRGLLSHFGLSRPLVSLPAFDEDRRAGSVLDRLAEGQCCALVTDAGMPAISDPGEKLVAEAVERDIPVVPVPGPSALLAALAVSGLPASRFQFLGFLPRKGPERRALLEEAGRSSATTVLFESPRRIAETIDELRQVCGDHRRACVARELTKMHEELSRGTLVQLADRLQGREVLGEVVLVVEGRRSSSTWSQEEVEKALRQGLAAGQKLKALSTELAREAGWSSQDIYRLGLGLKSKRGDEGAGGGSN